MRRHPDSRYLTGFAGAWADDAESDPNIAWVRDAWAAIRPFSTGGNYVNFQLAEDGSARTAASYGPISRACGGQGHLRPAQPVPCQPLRRTSSRIVWPATPGGREAAGARCRGSDSRLAGVEVVLGEQPPTIRVPDVIVTHTSSYEANPPRYAAADVLLAVELLSDGTRRVDRVLKFFEYADAGIPRYWIIDLNPPTTLAAYLLVDGEYELSPRALAVA